MTKKDIEKLINEHIEGMHNCNIPIEKIIRYQSVLNDFYNTKIKNIKES